MIIIEERYIERLSDRERKIERDRDREIRGGGEGRGNVLLYSGNAGLYRR